MFIPGENNYFVMSISQENNFQVDIKNKLLLLYSNQVDCFPINTPSVFVIPYLTKPFGSFEATCPQVTSAAVTFHDIIVKSQEELTSTCTHPIKGCGQGKQSCSHRILFRIGAVLRAEIIRADDEQEINRSGSPQKKIIPVTTTPWFTLFKNKYYCTLQPQSHFHIILGLISVLAGTFCISSLSCNCPSTHTSINLSMTHLFSVGRVFFFFFF